MTQTNPSELETRRDLWRIGDLVELGLRTIRDGGSTTPRLDAELLLAHVLSSERIELYMHWDAAVSATDYGRFCELLSRRSAGCPVAYLIGEREFFCRSFLVNPSVLIPRPETEHIILGALDFARQVAVKTIVDVGTGCGNLAVTLAAELAGASGWALDVSRDALALAERNAERHCVAERLTFVVSDLFAALAPDLKFDLIVSNPPYVPTAQLAQLPIDVRDFEPHRSLDGGPDGLAVVRRLIEGSGSRLVSGGRLLLEIGPQQERPVHEFAAARACWQIQPTIKDLARQPRVVVLQHSASTA
jgi:release factor glutamine methyltransferase